MTLDQDQIARAIAQAKAERGAYIRSHAKRIAARVPILRSVLAAALAVAATNSPTYANAGRSPLFPAPIELYVEHVIDGDTIVVILPDGEEHRIRLMGIDAASLHAPKCLPEFVAAADAKAVLVRLIADSPVTLTNVRPHTDRNGDTVARVFTADGEDAGQFLADACLAHSADSICLDWCTGAPLPAPKE